MPAISFACVPNILTSQILPAQHTSPVCVATKRGPTATACHAAPIWCSSGTCRLPSARSLQCPGTNRTAGTLWDSLTIFDAFKHDYNVGKMVNQCQALETLHGNWVYCCAPPRETPRPAHARRTCCHQGVPTRRVWRRKRWWWLWWWWC